MAMVTVYSPEETFDRLMRAIFTVRKYHMMLDTIKMAYRKHHLDDPSIGWEELSDNMQNTMCEIMGDSSFCEFIEQYRDKHAEACYKYSE